jgi:hypothetical protein
MVADGLEDHLFAVDSYVYMVTDGLEDHLFTVDSYGYVPYLL